MSKDLFQIDDRTWWSPRKKGLPVLPPSRDTGIVVSVWRGEHPSPEFKGYKVWYTGYRKTLASLFKQAYSNNLADLIPSYNPLELFLRRIGK